MLTSIKPLVNLFECIASDRSLEVTINENFIDCVAIPSTGNYSVICDPALEKGKQNKHKNKTTNIIKNLFLS